MTFRKIFVAFMVIASLLSIVLFVPWSMIINSVKPLPDTVQEELDKNTFFEGMIVYISNPEGSNTYVGGLSDREGHVPTQSDDLFKIGSITKLYIAAEVVMLVDEGLLSMEDKLSELLPEYKDRIEYSDKITLQNLMMHRSGIPNYTDHNFNWDNPPKANEACLELVLDMEADFVPDAKYAYSNTNYLLLGMIMDKILDQGYEAYMEEHIFEPLDLEDTYHRMELCDTNRLMGGYVKGYEPNIKGNDFASPAGSMVATASDVGVFLRALNESTILTPTQQEMYESVYPLEHTGFLPGYQSIARYDRESDTYLVVFGNTSDGSQWRDIEVLYDRVLKISKRNP